MATLWTPHGGKNRADIYLKGQLDGVVVCDTFKLGEDQL